MCLNQNLHSRSLTMRRSVLFRQALLIWMVRASAPESRSLVRTHGGDSSFWEMPLGNRFSITMGHKEDDQGTLEMGWIFGNFGTKTLSSMSHGGPHPAG